jgi:hypothetical protein
MSLSFSAIILDVSAAARAVIKTVPLLNKIIYSAWLLKKPRSKDYSCPLFLKLKLDLVQQLLL